MRPKPKADAECQFVTQSAIICSTLYRLQTGHAGSHQLTPFGRELPGPFRNQRMKHPRNITARTILALGFALLCGAPPPGAAAQSLGACNSFYSPGFTLAEGKLNPSQPAMNKPAKGVAVR